MPTGTDLPTDTNGDGKYDEVNGNGCADFADVALSFNQTSWSAIATTTDGGETVYSVADNGIGFPAEDSARVFDDFTRLHDAREHEGPGIGLPLVRRIVERHGGCRAESAPDEGSTFVFTLPAV
ncbi:MAG: ATP-binding protein [Methanospirillum sp.]